MTVSVGGPLWPRRVKACFQAQEAERLQVAAGLGEPPSVWRLDSGVNSHSNSAWYRRILNTVPLFTKQNEGPPT